LKYFKTGNFLSSKKLHGTVLFCYISAFFIIICGITVRIIEVRNEQLYLTACNVPELIV
jgi:hypothetical protein